MVTSLPERFSTTARLSNQDPLPQSKSNGNGGNGAHHRRHRPRFYDGARLAAARGYAGARFVLDYGASIANASLWVASNPRYIAALLAVIESGNTALLKSVLDGRVPVLVAGEQATLFVRLLKAYRAATPATRTAFCRTVGQEKLFDELIAPTFEAEASVEELRAAE
jgi:hypothetical protein